MLVGPVEGVTLVRAELRARVEVTRFSSRSCGDLQPGLCAEAALVSRVIT